MEKYLIKRILAEQKQETEVILADKIIDRGIAREYGRKILPTDLVKVIMGLPPKTAASSEEQNHPLKRPSLPTFAPRRPRPRPYGETSVGQSGS